MASVTTCKQCGALIRWVQMASGSRIACEPGPTATGTILARRERSGAFVAGVQDHTGKVIIGWLRWTVHGPVCARNNTGRVPMTPDIKAAILAGIKKEDS